MKDPLRPRRVVLHKQSQQLELAYEDVSHRLDAELLRVYSPSAEVRGHGASAPVRPAGKRHVRLLKVEAQGHYALKLSFDDGHDSGIYTWAYLRDLGEHAAAYFQAYSDELQAKGQFRDPDESPVKFF